RGAGAVPLRAARPPIRRRAGAHLQSGSLRDRQQSRGVLPMRIVLALLLLTACAGRKPDGPPDTEVQIVDELGEPLLGTSSFWARVTQDKCVQYGESCTVALPTGDYSLTFRKERAGRPGSQIGGTVESERVAGCLRGRVHVGPGQNVVGRQEGEL